MAHDIQRRLAVLALTDLQEWRVAGGLHRIALGIDQKQAVLLSPDLAAEDETGLGAAAALAHLGFELLLHRHADPAHVVGRLEQVAGAQQVGVRRRSGGRRGGWRRGFSERVGGQGALQGGCFGPTPPLGAEGGGEGGGGPGWKVGARVVPLVQVALDPVEHRLGGGQVARRQQHEQPVGCRLEHMHLAVGGDVVHPRIGARIGGEYQARVQQKGHAVGHRAPRG
ncbi:MAG: hypothetical protein ACKO50_14040 [Cyanobium sp.]